MSSEQKQIVALCGGRKKHTSHCLECENRSGEPCHSPVKDYVTLRGPTACVSFIKSVLLFCCHQRHLPKLIWSCINSQNPLGCFFLIRKFKFSSVISSPFPFCCQNLFSLVSLIKKKKLFSIPWSGGGEVQHNFFLLSRRFYPFFKVLCILQGLVDWLGLSTNRSLIFLHEMNVPIQSGSTS